MSSVPQLRRRPVQEPQALAARTRQRVRPTIIIGGGVAGLACARQLHAAGQQFLLISQDLGGRICRSRDHAMNLGAYYVRADYHHVNQFVQRGRRINALRTQRHDRDGAYTLWDRRLLLHLPQATRFFTKLLIFRRHYETLKRNCLTMSQAQALRADPHLWRLYHQSALEFISENRFGDIARYFLAPGLRGTTFLPLRRLTAFSVLHGALPVIVPAYEFTFRPDALTDGFTHALLVDTVTEITAEDPGYRIDTRASGSFAAHSVVVATPVDVSQQLLHLSEVKGPAQAHMFEIAGNLRAPYDQADINFFSETDPTLAMARQANGSILFCSHQRSPSFDHYFTDWEVIEHKHWSPAFHLDGRTLLECQRGPSLYLIGDHNICGLEDAYITGLYAANRIVDDRTRSGDGLPRPACPTEQPHVA